MGGGGNQYTSQFLMRERIGPSQADGNPALPGVVFLHCLSAGCQVFWYCFVQQHPNRTVTAITPER